MTHLLCVDCGVSEEETPLYRSNPKGEWAIWKCEDCMDQMPDHKLRRLANLIAGKS